MSVSIWLQEDGAFVLLCPTCDEKILFAKKDISLDVFVCATCKSEVKNPVGVIPVHIVEVADDGWEDVGLGVWEELADELVEEELDEEEALAATSDASSAAVSS